ncbi:hypothetical protein DPMN_187741 [Dreissena polymorpha]|uniref:Uncharacterized protein n=1 Tax=Dreissena polymorpha TaxID=45954 RepID=A0A9D4DPM4_DREPO|nr:hypothetical protein DPMN_187741 [Dreissena polymorpha]
MLGILEDAQKSNRPAHVPAVAHAFNSTRHESNSLTLSHVRSSSTFAFDAVLGIEPDEYSRTRDRKEYVYGKQKRLQFVYRVLIRWRFGKQLVRQSDITGDIT